MQWIFKKDGVEIQVPIEKWVWSVLYKDGTSLEQFDKEGIFHQIGEVKQENVAVFTMRKIDGKMIHIAIPEGAKIIHKYRNYIMNFGSPEEKRERIFIFGYKKDNSHSHFNFILPNDDIIESDNENVPLTWFNL